MASSSRTGHPVHTALPTRSPPTSLETHVRVTSASCICLDCNVFQSISISRSTMPVTLSFHSPASMRGTTMAVSMR